MPTHLNPASKTDSFLARTQREEGSFVLRKAGEGWDTKTKGAGNRRDLVPSPNKKYFLVGADPKMTEVPWSSWHFGISSN